MSENGTGESPESNRCSIPHPNPERAGWPARPLVIFRGRGLWARDSRLLSSTPTPTNGSSAPGFLRRSRRLLTIDEFKQAAIERYNPVALVPADTDEGSQLGSIFESLTVVFLQ